MRAPFGWATMKVINEKRIMIGRDCRFFVVANSVSFPGNDWNRGGVMARDEKGTRGLVAELTSISSLTRAMRAKRLS